MLVNHLRVFRQISLSPQDKFRHLRQMNTKTARKKPILALSMDANALAEFEKVAKSEHMEPARFAALIISKFSDVKQGHGLSALAGIPKDNFKLRPGRTPTTASESDLRFVGTPAQNPV